MEIFICMFYIDEDLVVLVHRQILFASLCFHFLQNRFYTFHNDIGDFLTAWFMAFLCASLCFHFMQNRFHTFNNGIGDFLTA